MESRHSSRKASDSEAERQVVFLTRLVALHLFVYSDAHAWLSPGQAVDTMRRWRTADSNVFDVLQRVRISSRALPIAIRLAECHGSLLDYVGMHKVFDSGRPIDAGAIQYLIIRRACERALLSDHP